MAKASAEDKEKLETQEIYEIIKNKIINLEYTPGQVLNEMEIADNYNISRTPVRRIFQMLSNDKLIMIIPRFGAQVAPIDFRQMKAIFEITRELDPFAARLAMERISDADIIKLEEIVDRLKNYNIDSDYQLAINDDESFHQIIYNSCGNQWLKDIMISLHYHTERLWHYCEDYFDKTDLFHRTLSHVLDGIKEKDAEKIDKYAKEHIDEFIGKIKSEMF